MQPRLQGGRLAWKSPFYRGLPGNSQDVALKHTQVFHQNVQNKVPSKWLTVKLYSKQSGVGFLGSLLREDGHESSPGVGRDTESWHFWSSCDRSEGVKHPKTAPWFGVLLEPVNLAVPECAVHSGNNTPQARRTLGQAAKASLAEEEGLEMPSEGEEASLSTPCERPQRGKP